MSFGYDTRQEGFYVRRELTSSSTPKGSSDIRFAQQDILLDVLARIEQAYLLRQLHLWHLRSRC